MAANGTHRLSSAWKVWVTVVLGPVFLSGPALAELKTSGQGKDMKLVAEQFSADDQGRMKIFEARCGKCHNLDRPIVALQTGKTPISGGAFDDEGVKAYVTKMMRKPNSGIEKDDAKEIIIFLRAARALAGG